MKNKLKYLSGVYGFIFLMICVFGFELFVIKIGGDLGGMLWVALHFVINPILAFIFICLTIAQTIDKNSHSNKLLNIALILISSLFIYLAITGNQWWLDFLNVNFE